MATSYVDQMLALQAEEQAIKEKREKLLAQAKAEALANAERAVADLNNLGFHYKLVEASTTTTPAARSPSTRSPRRGGITETVLDLIKKSEAGMTRSQLIAALDAQDKAAQQSISNALANMKKKGTLAANDGVYTAV